MNGLPQDRVPNTLDEAVADIIAAMSDPEKAQIRKMSIEEFGATSHFGLGMHMRNEFSLWEDTPLTRWFREHLKLGHADDLSSVITDAAACDIKGVSRNTAALVERFHEHWKGYGCNVFGEPE